MKGASQGEGLGNKFLANIREVDAIVHVIRCFEDEDVIHVSGSVGPSRDAEVINLELGLADLAQIEKRRERLKKQMRTSKEAQVEDAALERIQAVLENGGAARSVDLNDEEAAMIKPLGLLTAKPIIYATNVSETTWLRAMPSALRWWNWPPKKVPKRCGSLPRWKRSWWNWEMRKPRTILKVSG